MGGFVLIPGFIFAGIGCILASLLSLVLCWAIIKVAPKDAPDGGRKTQQSAIPTSGGLAIAGTILVFASLGLNLLSAMPAAFMLLFVGVLLIGAFDDARSVGATPRILALLVLTLYCAGYGGSFYRVFIPIADSILLLPLWLAIGGTALWIFVLLNATNFMDGSNGLAMGSLAIMFGGLAVHSSSISDAATLTFALLMVAAILGFLFWNLQGKLYAGDAGSLFGGAVFASLGIYAAQDGNIWFPATLALPFLIDVFMTLGWRAMRRQNLLEPHRHHAYQGLIKAGWSHIRVALLWWGFTLGCATAALWAAGDSKSMSAYIFLGLLVSGSGLWLIHRIRLPEEIKLAP